MVAFLFERSRRGPPVLRGSLIVWLILSAVTALPARAADLMIYEDGLASGWEDWSWSTTAAVATDIKVTGASSLAVTYSAGWGGLSLRTSPAIATAGYSGLRFSVYGRPGSGALSLFTQPTDNGANSASFQFTPTPDVWSVVDVPLSALGNPTEIARINIQDRTGAVPPTYNLDTLRLIGIDLPPLALTVDAAAQRKPISPLIYGVNGQSATSADAAFLTSLGVSVRRWGGNNTTRYNWMLDAGNTANDWYYENVRLSDAAGPPDDSATNRLIAQGRPLGVETALTLPMIGYVAKNGDLSTCGFSVAKYGPQQQVDAWRPDCGNGVKTDGSLVAGNDPADTSLVIDPGFVQTWVTYLVNRYGSASNGGVRYYNLDNEPDIWWSTHADVAPVALNYDQLRDRTYQYAAAIKTADPTAQTLGPVVMGWTYYWNSPWDGQRGDWSTPDDRNAHGGTPLVPWYLQQMQAYEQAHGTRILDFLDLHYYTAAPGVALSVAGDATTQALRLNSTRSLWDPTYVDESWIAAAGPDGGIVRLIPRMREWVRSNYPGTKLAITEYNWGAPEHINGALAQADVLGIFGREGLDFATLWSPPASTEPAAFAFRIYRNYDGAGGRFGETSVSASSNAQDRLACYAAEETATGALTLIVINKTADALSAPLTLSHFAPAGTLQGWRYSSAQLTAIVRLADRTFSGATFTDSYPGNSITLYRVPQFCWDCLPGRGGWRAIF
ncbi:glycoside hydrolase family 44 protein [uncultured Thiodictyon sp.]|uniref:glycoside hydrolase family 44 protein n=1 Tax=uncultured Thiodictyon sp. TaxID=1846217 RepID=UPI0025EEC1DB|nr:glycoside hydrolase family 44 protein [uncultured Thiodictyon sp.]